MSPKVLTIVAVASIFLTSIVCGLIFVLMDAGFKTAVKEIQTKSAPQLAEVEDHKEKLVGIREELTELTTAYQKSKDELDLKRAELSEVKHTRKRLESDVVTQTEQVSALRARIDASKAAAAEAAAAAPVNEVQPETERVWTNTKGQTMRATFVRLEGDTAHFTMSNGKSAAVPLNLLSKPDQDYIKKR